MNTVAAGVRPAKLNRIVDDRRIPAWTDDPRVRRLLVSCAKLPPQGRYVHSTLPLEGERDCSFEFDGYRAEALTVIRRQHGRRVRAVCEASGNFTAWEDFCCQPSVTAAIDAAMLAGRYAAAAARLRDELIATAVKPFEMKEAA